MLEVAIKLHQGDFKLDVAFAVPSNAITALFGPSGSGKSTVLAALAGLRTSEGRIALEQQVYLDSNINLRVPPHKRGFGLLFQETRLFPHLTVAQNIAYALRRAPKRPISLEELSEFFEIKNLLDRAIGHLSGGEESRVGLARALAAAPEFLLLDEPFAALDGPRRRNYIDVLLSVHRRFAIPMMVVTHSIDDAAALASHVLALKDGNVAAQGEFVDVVREAAFQTLLDARDVGMIVSPAKLRSATGRDSQGLWLRADHVLLANSRPSGLSARNVLECKIVRIEQESSASVLIALDSNVGYLLARLTPEAVAELELAPGKPAWAVVKSHAV